MSAAPAASSPEAADERAKPRFDKTHCSQCGGEFGPDDEGFSHCSDHQPKRLDCLPVPTDRNQGWPGVYAVLYTDEINGEQTSRDDLWIGTTAAIQTAVDRAQQEAYAEGRKDEAEGKAHRGYVLFGAGAYLLTICKGDERGPELVVHLATDAEKQGRTVGDLGDVVPDKEIPLERVAVRLQFASERGLFSLEQQLRMLRDQHFHAAATGAAS